MAIFQGEHLDYEVQRSAAGTTGNVGYGREIVIFQGKTPAEPLHHGGEGSAAGTPGKVGYGRDRVIILNGKPESHCGTSPPRSGRKLHGA